MPRLYCDRHGKEHAAMAAGNAAIYRDEGESVLIVVGKLKAASHDCDQCGRHLRRGEAAYLVTPFPRWITGQMHHYDFEYEQKYFPMRGAEEIVVHGAAWPGGDPAAMLWRVADA